MVCVCARVCAVVPDVGDPYKYNLLLHIHGVKRQPAIGKVASKKKSQRRDTRNKTNLNSAVKGGRRTTEDKPQQIANERVCLCVYYMQ